MTENSTFYKISSNAIAVLDIGVSTQKFVVLDPEKPDEPLSYQRIYFALKDKKNEFDTFLKSLLRSYSDFGIRKFILTTSASPVFDSAKETIEFISNVITKYINPKNLLCFTKDGNFVPIEKAKKEPEKIVSAGWKALGVGASYLAQTDALIVEFATRTTSFIPVKDYKIVSNANDDHDRVKNKELLFYGLLETNAAFIENTFTCKDEVYFLPFENHAKTADIFLVTKDLQSSDYIQEIGLGKEQVRELAFQNIAKMFSIIDPKYDKKILVEYAMDIRDKLINTIIRIIDIKLDEYNLENIILVGIGEEILYQHLVNKTKAKNIIQGKNLLHITEINPAYAIGAIYAQRMNLNE